MCVPWESNPQPFALLTQCSTTESQEHRHNSSTSSQICIYSSLCSCFADVTTCLDFFPPSRSESSTLSLRDVVTSWSILLSLSASPPLLPHRPSSSHSPSGRRSAWPTKSSSEPTGSIPRTSARKTTAISWARRRCIMTTSSISPTLKTVKRWLQHWKLLYSSYK